ncbi:MAG: methyltransferase domain-containing protein, partial [Halobacteria archaeon]|nr:methyltransferase domain-containing protein [Halobacteria archaeon]
MDIDWDSDHYDEDHSYVYDYGEDVLELLSPENGERLLDLGCGTGNLTKKIAEDVGDEDDVVGVDMAPDMVESARMKHPNLEFIRSDARYMGFDSEFDAVFSNAALHWMDEPRRVAESVYDAL